jgi:HEAT repeat protein
MTALLLSLLLMAGLALPEASGESVDDKLTAFKRNYGNSLEAREKALKALKPLDDPRLLDCVVTALSDEPQTDASCHHTVYEAAASVLRTMTGEKVMKQARSLLQHRESARVRRYFARALGEVRDADSLTALVKAVKGEKDGSVLSEMADSLGEYREKAAWDGLRAIAELDRSAAAAQRAVWALSCENCPETTMHLRELCGNAKLEGIVAAEALLTLADRSADTSAFATAFGGSKDPFRRMAACEAAAAAGIAAFSGNALALLEDDNWQVRIAAARACSALKNAKAVEPLIGLWKKEGDSRASIEYHAALLVLTGKSFGPNWRYWENWYKSLNQPIDEAAAQAGEYVEYLGQRIRSKNICFVLDRSKNMREKAGKLVEATNPKSKAAGESKLEVIVGELSRVITELPQDCRFNIVVFDHRVESWRPGTAQASPGVKKEAVEWLGKQKAGGWTNVYGALSAAAGGSGDKAPALSDTADTVVILSDGGATVGDFVSDSAIRREFARLNRQRKVVLHAFGLTKGSKDAQ